MKATDNRKKKVVFRRIQGKVRPITVYDDTTLNVTKAAGTGAIGGLAAIAGVKALKKIGFVSGARGFIAGGIVGGALGTAVHVMGAKKAAKAGG